MIKNISIAYIILVAFLSIFAYFFIPDNSTNANQMHLSIHSKPPGFKVDLLLIENNIKYDQTLFEKLFFGNKNSPTEIALQNYNLNKRTFYYNEYGDFSAEFNNSIEIDDINKFKSNNLINRVFLLGTDKFGRDVLSRLVVGARISFFIGFISVLISLIIGVFLGSLSGYYSR